VVAAAEAVVDGGEVESARGDLLHDLREVAAGEDGVLAAGAADAGAGLGGVDVFVGLVVVVEVGVDARGGCLECGCDLEWAGVEFASFGRHGLVGGALGVVVLFVCQVVSRV